MSNVYICPDFIGCQSCKRKLDFSSDARGRSNVPIVQLEVGRDLEDDSFQKYGEFTLNTGANWTVISMEAAAKLGIDVEKWGTMIQLLPNLLEKTKGISPNYFRNFLIGIAVFDHPTRNIL